jgi:LacI family transcriptional regulator
MGDSQTTRKITIQDIAKAAGVSSQTVSRVLNNRPDVADETRQRVDAVIKQLDYRPSELARGLRSKTTRTIAVVVPDSANPFFAEIAKGVENAGFEAGYTVILCNSARQLDRELKYLDVLRSKAVDGIIFITTTAHIDHIRPLIQDGIPIVLFFRDAGNLDVDTFKIDNRLAGYLATRHLLNLGHTAIACIRPGGRPETPSSRRVDGYKQALEEANVLWNPILMPQGDNLFSGGEQAARDLVRAEIPFTAIFAANDAMAIGAMRALREQGRRVPDDVSVAGIDDILLASYSEPPLTTVAQLKQEAGNLAVRCLIERIENKHINGPRETILDVQLVVRQSTGPVPIKG